MLKQDKVRLSNTNCYLIKVSGGYLLVDCGGPGDAGALSKALQKRGLTFASIRYLLLTHHHADHCGLLTHLIAENPDLRVIMSRTCAAYLSEGCNISHPEEQYASVSLQCFFQIINRLRPLPVTFPAYIARSTDLIIADSVTPLPIPGLEGILLATPGHTPDGISLIIGEDAYVGDAARNLLNLLGAIHEPILVYDRNICHVNWELLLSYQVKHIHPGHGRSFRIRALFPKKSPV